MVTFIKEHILLITLTCLFAALAVFVASGSTIEFDTAGVLSLRSAQNPDMAIGGQAMVSLVSNLTHLGDSLTLAILSVSVICVLCYYRMHTLAIWFSVAAAGSFIITAASKFLFARARPDIVEQFAHATSGSFPSGHTLRSAVVYTALAYLLMQTRFCSNHKSTISLFALTIIVANGVSRIYLGVHWPTDIVGAWLIAGFWILLCKKGYDKVATVKGKKE